METYRRLCCMYILFGFAFIRACMCVQQETESEFQLMIKQIEANTFDWLSNKFQVHIDFM